MSSSRDSDPCLDTEEVDVSELKMPEKYANLTPPWIRADGTPAKVTRSDGLSYRWNWMKSLAVTGLSGIVEDVINFLTDNNCYFVPVGPSVRSAILKEKTVYLSGEVSCELHELYGKCLAKFGSTGCSLYPIENGGWGAYRLEIGDANSNRSTYQVKAEPIALHEWRSLIGASADHWRFTVDTLAIFDDGIGHAYVIDPTRDGYHHLCDKKLALPTDDWAEWSRNQPLKVMGFYELRSTGFSAKNESLQRFINEEVKLIDRRDVQKFYCENVLRGVASLEGHTPICHTRYPEKDDQWITSLRKTMINEMGEIWNSSIQGATDQLEAVFLTDHQLADVRHRLLHRVSSSDAGIFITQEPSIIEEGKPMIKDSANVHSRPILDMSAQAPILPPEYPNAPRAQPNEHLEFVEPPVEGGGMAPIAIQLHKGPKFIEDEGEEEHLDAKRVEIGKPADAPTENEYNQQNSMNVELPVMRFDKVEENGLPDVAASAMDSQSSGGEYQRILPSLFIPIVILLYTLI